MIILLMATTDLPGFHFPPHPSGASSLPLVLRAGVAAAAARGQPRMTGEPLQALRMQSSCPQEAMEAEMFFAAESREPTRLSEVCPGDSGTTILRHGFVHRRRQLLRGTHGAAVTAPSRCRNRAKSKPGDVGPGAFAGVLSTSTLSLQSP